MIKILIQLDLFFCRIKSNQSPEGFPRPHNALLGIRNATCGFRWKPVVAGVFLPKWPFWGPTRPRADACSLGGPQKSVWRRTQLPSHSEASGWAKSSPMWVPGACTGNHIIKNKSEIQSLKFCPSNVSYPMREEIKTVSSLLLPPPARWRQHRKNLRNIVPMLWTLRRGS